MALQPTQPGAKDRVQAIGRALAAQLSAAGFRQVRLEIRPMKPIGTICALEVG